MPTRYQTWDMVMNEQEDSVLDPLTVLRIIEVWPLAFCVLYWGTVSPPLRDGALLRVLPKSGC